MSDVREAIDACFICGLEDCDHSEDQQLAFIAAEVAGRDQPVLASDPDPKARRRERGKINREIADLQWLMSHANGRRVMYGLIKRCGLMTNTFAAVQGKPEMAMQMAFLEGHRNVGNQYFDLVQNHCPAEYFKMIEESKS